MERNEKRFRRDGMTFCTFFVTREETGIPRADQLYERFCRAAETHAEQVVTLRAAEQYDADENPRKRFRFSPATCECHVLVTHKEDLVEVSGRYTAMGAEVCRFTHLWDPALELLVPPTAKRRRKERENRAKKAESGQRRKNG